MSGNSETEMPPRIKELVNWLRAKGLHDEEIAMWIGFMPKEPKDRRHHKEFTRLTNEEELVILLWGLGRKVEQIGPRLRKSPSEIKALMKKARDRTGKKSQTLVWDLGVVTGLMCAYDLLITCPPDKDLKEYVEEIPADLPGICHGALLSKRRRWIAASRSVRFSNTPRINRGDFLSLRGNVNNFLLGFHT